MKNFTLNLFILLFTSLLTNALYSQTCTHTIIGNDSYGDGWNGAELNITVNGSIVVSGFTLTGWGTYSNQATFQAATDDSIEIDWISAGSYPNEISWSLTDGSGSPISSGANPVAGVTGPFLGVCASCVAPSDLSVSSITTSGAIVSWTDDGTNSYELEYGLAGFTQGAGTLVTASTPYSITGLSSATSYDVYSRTDCGGEYSDWVSETFTTECSTVTSFPYAHGFEDLNCWTNSDSTAAWAIDSGDDYGPGSVTEGTSAVFFNDYDYAEDETSDLMSPNLDLSYLTSARLTFDYYDGDGSDTVEVLVDDGSGAVVVYTTDSTVDSWTTIDVDLPDYAGQTVKIGFRGTSVWGSTNPHIDNLSVAEAPSCLAPTALSATASSATEATVSWTAGDSETAWQYVVQPSGTGEPTGAGTATTTNPLSLAGLTAQTDYEIYLRADCGGDYSTWVSTSFTTLCPAFTAPYSQDFTGFTVSTSAFSDESCWSATNTAVFWEVAATTDTSSGGTGPGAGVSDGNYMLFEASAAGTNAVLSSPQVDLSSLTTAALSFDYHMFGSTMGDLVVSIVDSSGAETTLETISGQQQTSETDAFINKLLVLSSYSGVVSFNFTASKGTDYESDISIDNFEIAEAPAICFSPTALVATATSSTEATVSWTAGNSETTWEYVVQAAGTGEPTTSGTLTTTNPLSLSGLTANTDYEIYLRADCGGDLPPQPGDTASADTSAWVSTTFTTLCDVFSVAFVNDFETSDQEGCWSVINGGDPNPWVLITSSGNTYWNISYNVAAHDDYLYSPVIQVADGVTDQFSFKAWNPGTTWPEIIDVLVVDPSDNSIIATLSTDLLLPGADNAAGAGATVFRYDLSPYEGQQVKIGFYSSTTNQNAARIDDFTVYADTEAPVITLVGDDPLELNIGDTYTDAGATATDNVDGDLTASIIVGGDAVDTSASGTFTVTYDVSDAAGNAATQVTRVVNVSCPAPTNLSVTNLTETSATLNWTSTGTAFMVEIQPSGVPQGTDTSLSGGYVVGDYLPVTTSSFDIPAGFLPANTAIDFWIINLCEYTGDGSAPIVITDSAISASGTFTTLADTEAPVMTLIGDNPLELNNGDVYTDPGVSITDNVDSGQTLQGALVVGGDVVDTSVDGSYTVTYDVSDAAGNAATQVTRVVNVTSPCTVSLGTEVAICDETTTGDSETLIAVWDFVNGSTAGVIGESFTTPTSNTSLGWLKSGDQSGVSDPHSVVQSGKNGFSAGYLPGIDFTSADLVDGKLHVSITYNKIDLTGTGAIQQLFLKGAGNSNYANGHRMVGLKLTHDATNSDIKVESIVFNNGEQYGVSKDQGGLGNSAIYSEQITLGTTMDFTNGTSSFWVGSPGENATNPYGLTMATNDVNQSTNWNENTVAMAPNAILKLLQFNSKNGTGSVEVDQVKISTGTYQNTVASGDAEEFYTATTGDTYSVTLPYSGAGNSTFVVGSTAGNVGGDDPSATADGNVTVSGVPVGTDVTITVNNTANGGTCDLSTTVTSPVCTPQSPGLELKGVLDLNATSVAGYNQSNSNGSDLKAIHLVATADIPTLNIYGIGVANNGGGTDANEIPLSFGTLIKGSRSNLSSGDDILLVRYAPTVQTYFEGCYDDFEVVIEVGGNMGQNGDDAIELYMNGQQGSTDGLVETFGDPNVDGSGEAWDYEDSWAYKVNGTWTYGGKNCTDGAVTNSTSDCPYPFCISLPAYDWTGSVSTAWHTDGNWAGGSVPDSSSDVTISDGLNNYPMVSTDASANSVSVATGATLTVSESGSLTTTGDFTNTGTVTMNSDSQEFSSLIVGGNSSGDIDYNRFVNNYSEPGDDNIQWDLIGSPVDGLEISSFADDNPSLATSGDYYAVGTYDNSSQLWTNYTSATSNGVNFDMGLGYQMATSVASSTVASSSSFNSGNTAWPYNVVGSLASDGNNGEAQTFEINVRSLPAGGANYRVYKTTSNGIDFFENGQPLSLGVNTITVTAVSFARTVKLQVSSGDIAFNSLIVNSQTLYGNTFSGSTLLFEGSVATVPQTQTITDNTTSGGDFWNLVSNPYPSYLNLNYKSNAINNFVSVNGVSVYGWKSGSNGAYTVYNQISPTPSTAQYIAPGQGFFVSAESASSVSFTNAMQTTSGSDDFVSGRMDGSYTYFYLNLNEGDDLIANSMFYFGDGMSYGFDAGYDAEAFRQSTKIMSRMLEGNVGLGMQVNAMPKEALDDSTVIPLEINQTAGTAFSIGLADVFNLAEDVEVYLEDTQLQTFTDLKAEDYTINPAYDLSGAGRFYLVFVNNSLGGNTMHESNIRIYNPLDEDYISIEGLLNVQNTKVNLYNIFGQQVLNTALNKNQSAHRISTAELAAGVYVIKLKADNAVISKKLIIR